MTSADRRRPASRPAPRDEGSTLILVLVLMVIGSLVVLPIMSYSMSVFRAQNVQGDKQRSVQAAQGGTWVALSNETGLWDMCDGSVLPSSLSGVTTTCSVLDVTAQYPPEQVPHSVGVVQADTALPGSIAAVPGAYANPNTVTPDPDDYDAWLDVPDWSPTNAAGKVWVPKLPVRTVSSGANRDRTMPAGTVEPGYSSCRVFFPGTFTSPIVIAEPTYFISGVYYFEESITIRNGADVVVGAGAAGGCTTDFNAIGLITPQPTPINFSGVGGTFVLGGRARVVVDDSGVGDIRFLMNQRYVEEGDLTTATSRGVSIASVNGTHAPLVAPEVVGDDLDVVGVISVPASVVGTDGDPLAVTGGYQPSVLTPKPTEPDAPTNVDFEPYQWGSGSNRGYVTVTWDVPNENGSLITTYTATDSLSGQTCSPPTPSPPDTSVQPSCTIEGLADGWRTVTVTATNAYGTSPASAPSSSKRVDLASGTQSPVLTVASEPQNAAIGTSYSDGLEITWDPPLTDGGGPITNYHVRAYETVSGALTSCEAWWDETSCVLPGLTDGLLYDIEVAAVSEYSGTEVEGASARIDGDALDAAPPEPDPHPYVIGTDPAPIQQPGVATVRVPEPIVDLQMGAGQVTVSIAGAVAVPQGHIRIDAAAPANKSVEMTGGVVAAQIRMDPAREPATLTMAFDNPIGQKRIRLRSTADLGYRAVSDAVIQLNRSGSLKINSWFKQ